jgi:hypothetical protein
MVGPNGSVDAPFQSHTVKHRVDIGFLACALFMAQQLRQHRAIPT